MGMEIKKIKQSTVRFSEAYFYKPNVEVLVLGLGGIGSWLTLNLARLECNLHLYDYDLIDEVNLAGQMYANTDIGLRKLDSINSLVNLLCDKPNIISLNEKYTNESLTGPIVFSCFDNMAARKLAFDKWKAEDDRELFIDGRMALSTGEVYCVTKGKEKEYERTLFDDSEVEDAACSMKATTFSGMAIASIMTALFCNYVGTTLNPDLPVNLSFKTTYNFPLMMFESI
jgi:molybdopterin/thiamine biosynthesis adenylyltransferase